MTMTKIALALSYVIVGGVLGGFLAGFDRILTARMQGRKGVSPYATVFRCA